MKRYESGAASPNFRTVITLVAALAKAGVVLIGHTGSISTLARPTPGGYQLIVLTQEEAERVAEDDCLSWVKSIECPNRTFDLEKIVRWAVANGYRPG
jgi:primosomal protein N'